MFIRAKRNGWSLSPSNYKCVVISKKTLPSLPKSIIDKAPIDYIDQATNLSITCNKNLYCMNHLVKASGRTLNQLRQLYFMQQFLPAAIRVMLWNRDFWTQ